MTGDSARFLLDTNIVIAYLNAEPRVVSRLETSQGLILPVVALAELCYGALKSTRPEENSRRVEDVASAVPLLSVDAETARVCAWTRMELQKLGKPVPTNDLWIAALARQHDLTLVTRDEHFQAMAWLRLEAW